MREETINEINDAIDSFDSVVDDFPTKLKMVKDEDHIESFDKVSLHSFFDPFLEYYCIEKIKSRQFDKVKKIFEKVEEVLIKYPGSYIENGIAVSFLEGLWGNHYEHHGLYIKYSGKHTLLLTLLVNQRFNHESESRAEISKKLKKID